MWARDVTYYKGSYCSHNVQICPHARQPCWQAQSIQCGMDSAINFGRTGMIFKCLLICHLIHSWGYLGPMACFQKTGNLYFFSSFHIYLYFLNAGRWFVSSISMSWLRTIGLDFQPLSHSLTESLGTALQKENYHQYWGPQRSRGREGTAPEEQGKGAMAFVMGETSVWHQR